MRLAATRREPQTEACTRTSGLGDAPDLDTLLTAGVRTGDAQLIDGDRRTGPEDLDFHIAFVAGALHAAGVRHGDVVAWQLPNGTESVLLTRACWRLGAIAAPLHHRSGRAELAPLVDLLEPTVLLASEDAALADWEGAVLVTPEVALARLPDGRPVNGATAMPSDLALVQFTSGSTGAPKAVLHTHRSLAAKTVQMVGVHGLGPGDATLVQSPLSHISGVLNGILVPQAAGMNQVLLDRWDPAIALALIDHERVTFVVGPPTVFHSLSEAAFDQPSALDSLRLVSCGGAGVTPEFVAEMTARLGAVVKRSYGSTEAPTITSWAAGDPPERAGATDGRAHGETEVVVVDPVTSERRAVGEPGEVRVRGPELFAGYALAAQTDAAMVDGWFCTGDLGVLDEEGWLTIVGRIKDVIIRGGENISPAEVERVLESHPAVRQAVVVGAPDDRLGERVVAFLVSHEPLDAAACLVWFTEQGVAKFKSPEVVVCVDRLPLLSLGKPDRAELTRRACALT